MLEFSQHTETKWNVFRGKGRKYIGSFWTGGGGGFICGSSVVTAAELRQIAAELDRLNEHNEAEGK